MFLFGTVGLLAGIAIFRGLSPLGRLSPEPFLPRCLLSALLSRRLSRVPGLLCLYPGVIHASVQHGSRVWSELLTLAYQRESMVRPAGITEPLSSRLLVQDLAEEVAMDRQRAVAIVIDKAEFPELIHKMTDPRPGSADHL